MHAHATQGKLVPDELMKCFFPDLGAHPRDLFAVCRRDREQARARLRRGGRHVPRHRLEGLVLQEVEVAVGVLQFPLQVVQPEQEAATLVGVEQEALSQPRFGQSRAHGRYLLEGRARDWHQPHQSTCTSKHRTGCQVDELREKINPHNLASVKEYLGNRNYT